MDGWSTRLERAGLNEQQSHGSGDPAQRSQPEGWRHSQRQNGEQVQKGSEESGCHQLGKAKQDLVDELAHIGPPVRRADAEATGAVAAVLYR